MSHDNKGIFAIVVVVGTLIAFGFSLKSCEEAEVAKIKAEQKAWEENRAPRQWRKADGSVQTLPQGVSEAEARMKDLEARIEVIRIQIDHEFNKLNKQLDDLLKQVNPEVPPIK